MNRIGMAAFGHETVTFWPGVTPKEEFDRIVLFGEEVLEQRRGTNTVMGGFIGICEEEGMDPVPFFDVEAEASAVVSDDAFEAYAGRMIRGFRSIGSDLAGILLYLHGAMVTESYLSPETELVRRIRDSVSDTLPIVCAFDLHGNLDPELPGLCTALVSYRKSPHTDMMETGRRAARILVDFCIGKTRPVCSVRKPGLVIPSVFSATTAPPGKDLYDEVLRLATTPGILDVSFLSGFAWSDTPQAGAAAVAVADGNKALAEETAEKLVRFAWERRKQFTGREGNMLFSVQEGVDRALRIGRARRPVLLLDHADRTNDTTFVLEELLARGAENAAVPLFRDPEAVRVCIEAGPGAEVELSVGGSTGWRDNGPVRVSGRVEWTGSGSYRGTGPMTAGKVIDIGPAAVVQCGGIWLQLVSYNFVLMDTDPFVQFGRRAEEFDIIVSKSKTHFRQVYGPIAEEIIIIDAPGQCPADLSVFDYTRVPPGVYPVTSRPAL